MSQVRQAVFYSSVSRYGMRLFGLASTMIVARLLTPEEIGTFAIASAIVMVISEFRLLGAGNYLIREKELTKDKIRSATGLTIIISWGLGILIWVAAPWVAEFYGLVPITTIFRILAVSFFLAPLISIPTSLLMRDFRFRELFFVRMILTITNFVTTISLILLGFSFYSLAWGYTLAVIAEFIVIFALRPSGMPWVPSFRRIQPILKFGIYNSLGNVFNRGVVTAPDMIIGRMGTTAQVGMFSRGLGFIEFVSQTLLMGVKPVALPYLSDVQRSGGSSNDAYIRASTMLGAMVWPVLAVASVVSLPAILLFFGDQWDAAAPYATFLAYWAMFRTMHWSSSDLLNAKGKEKIMVIKEGMMFGLYFGGVVLAFPLGLLSVAATFAGLGLVDMLITTVFLARYVKLSPFDFLKAWGSNILLTLICWGAASVIYVMFSGEDGRAIFALIMVASILPFVWVAGLYVTRNPLRNEVGIALTWLKDKISK